MPQDSSDPIVVDIEPTDSAYRQNVHWRILREREKTANIVALILVWGVVLSLPVYLTVVLIRPDQSDKVSPIFDKWYTVISPLVGAAIGAYYGARVFQGDHRR
jgi:hypothetical protein